MSTITAEHLALARTLIDITQGTAPDKMSFTLEVRPDGTMDATPLLVAAALAVTAALQAAAYCSPLEPAEILDITRQALGDSDAGREFFDRGHGQDTRV